MQKLFLFIYALFAGREVVHLTLPLDIISLQVKSRSMLHHGSVGAILKQNKRNLKKPNPNPNPNP